MDELVRKKPVTNDDDWIHEGLPPCGTTAWVWFGGNQTRRVKRGSDFGEMLFVDCTHPAQNAYCDAESVKAWRLAGQEIQPPPTREMNEALSSAANGRSIFG